MSTDFLTIILLSTLAGLATGLGGLVVLVRKPGKTFCILNRIGCWNNDYDFVHGKASI